MNKKRRQVLIVDDHPALCEGLSYRISSQPDLSVCGQAADVPTALKKIGEMAPDLVIVDIALKDSDGLELIKAVKARYPRTRTLVHSMYEESLYADRCLRAGAMGFVNKEADPNEVIRAIRKVLGGRVHLSPTMTSYVLSRTSSGAASETDPLDTLTDRQLEVFRLMGAGQSVAQIANRLHISVHTVETHRENIKRKLSVTSTPELMRRATLWATGNSQD